MLNIILTLFPNVTGIKINHLSSIDSLFLDNIISFININKRYNLNYLEFEIAKEYDYANIGLFSFKILECYVHIFIFHHKII